MRSGETKAFRAGKRVAQWPIISGLLGGANRRRPAFRDDGGAPAFRQRHAAARRKRVTSPLWAAARFVWLFPIAAFGAVLIFFGLWIVGIAVVGDATIRSYWGWAALFSVVAAWDCIVGKSGLGTGALDLRRMMNSPSGGAWGAIATYFRSLFVLAYGCYVVFFWLIVGVGIWMWQSGAWQHAVAAARAG
ncbi:MAG: hypothetical protein ACREFO_05880 [Acetobacteraceae bacterium]